MTGKGLNNHNLGENENIPSQGFFSRGPLRVAAYLDYVETERAVWVGFDAAD